jgi:hypothetical protein
MVNDAKVRRVIGLIFLTTNRLTEFDPAFESRIHFKLFYDPLTPVQRSKVWRNLLPSSTQWEDDFLLKLGKKYDMNGREIKNMVKTAIALAEKENMPLDEKHLRAIEAMNENWSRKAKENA